MDDSWWWDKSCGLSSIFFVSYDDFSGLADQKLVLMKRRYLH